MTAKLSKWMERCSNNDRNIVLSNFHIVLRLRPARMSVAARRRSPIVGTVCRCCMCAKKRVINFRHRNMLIINSAIFQGTMELEVCDHMVLLCDRGKGSWLHFVYFPVRFPMYDKSLLSKLFKISLRNLIGTSAEGWEMIQGTNVSDRYGPKPVIIHSWRTGGIPGGRRVRSVVLEYWINFDRHFRTRTSSTERGHLPIIT